MKFADLTDELVRSRRLKDIEGYKDFFGKTNEEIETELFGVPAIDYLEIMSNMEVAIPVGRTDLDKTQTTGKILKEYKGIYSVK